MPPEPRWNVDGAGRRRDEEDSSPRSFDLPLTVPLPLDWPKGGKLLVGSSASIALLSFLLALCGSSLVFPARVVLVILTLLFAGLAILRYALWDRPRGGLQVTLNGFVITSPTGRVVYYDDQVVGLSLRAAIGFPNDFRHTITIEIDEGGDPVCRPRIVVSGEPDRWAAFLQRLQDRLVRDFTVRRERGAILAGVGWRIDARSLTYESGRGEYVQPIEGIQMAGVFDGEVCLWRDDGEAPFLIVPNGSRNAPILAAFLRAEVGDPSKAPPLPGKPLGRRLYKRSCGDHRLGWTGVLLMPVWWLLVYFDDPGEGGFNSSALFAIIGSGLALASITSFFFWRGFRYRSIVIHENGVMQSGRGGGRALLYSEVEAFGCDGNAKLYFFPAPGSTLRPIRFRQLIPRYDPYLGALIDHLNDSIAYRMAVAQRTEPVRWTAQLRFLPGGLEYQSRGMLGTGPPITVPYYLTSYRMSTRHCTFYIDGRDDLVLSESITVPNFYYPGPEEDHCGMTRRPHPPQPPSPAGRGGSQTGLW